MTYYGDDCFPADTHPTPFQFVIVYTLTLQCFPACAPYSTLHPFVMPTPSPLSSLPTLTRSSAFPSQSCRSVSVWSQEGRRRLRQCWSTTLTRSSSLAALLWATLSCRQHCCGPPCHAGSSQAPHSSHHIYFNMHHSI